MGSPLGRPTVKGGKLIDQGVCGSSSISNEGWTAGLESGWPRHKELLCKTCQHGSEGCVWDLIHQRRVRAVLLKDLDGAVRGDQRCAICSEEWERTYRSKTGVFRCAESSPHQRALLLNLAQFANAN